MPRRNPRAGGPKGTALNTPFRELRKLSSGLPTSAARKPPQRSSRGVSADAAPEDDEALFRTATAGVVPIPPEARNLTEAPPLPAQPLSAREREEAEVLWELSELVSGNGSFEVSDSDEYVEGRVSGLDPRIMQRLRAGEFAYQTFIDLHGLTAEEAKGTVRQFVLRALRAGHRCLLIVHGRGHNSRDHRPVLKDGLKAWLCRGELAHVVMGFCSARACDGGAGAMYVLLRRQRRRKKSFETFEGTKS